MEYDNALEYIYDIIGCSDVARKPNLSYKLGNATQKAKPIDLCSEADWNGCLEDVTAAEKKKKNESVPVMIHVSDVVSYVRTLTCNRMTH